MTTVSNTFICPSCASGLNVKEGQKPDVCSNCGYRFGTQPQTVYRLPKPLIQQYRERLTARLTSIPPMPPSLDVAEVHQKDAKTRYMAAQEARVREEEQEILRSTIINMSEPYIRDTIDSFARIVMTSSQLGAPTRKYLEFILKHCALVINNVQQGYEAGVDYGTKNARPLPGDPDIIDTGTRGVSASGERNTGGYSSK